MAKQLRALQTEQKIKDAFAELLKTRPLQEVSIQSICQLAGVSVGAFYHNFRSKDELIVDVLLGTRGGFINKIEERLTDNALQNVRIFLFSNAEMSAQADIGFLRELYTAHIHYGDRISMISESAGYLLLGEIIQHGQEMNQIRKDVSAQQLADLIIMAWEGYLYHWCCNGGAYSLTEYLSSRIDSIITLLKDEGQAQ